MGLILFIFTAIALLTLFIGKRAYRFYTFYKRVNKIPGPQFKIPFFVEFGEDTTFIVKNEPIDINDFSADRFGWFGNMCKQYKDGYVKIWHGTTPVVHIRKPDHIKVLLRSNTQIRKAEMYTFLEPWLGKGLVTSTGLQWFRSRKLITPAFHFSILEGLAEVMINKAAILNKCIEREIKRHGEKSFDIFQLAAKCTLDVICETAMGVDVHAQEEVENEYIRSVHKISSGIVYRFFRPWLKPDWIYYKVPAGRDFKTAVDTAHELCTRVIKRKQQERKGGCTDINETEVNEAKDEFGKRKLKAFLDLLLEANEKEENPLSTEELRDQTNTFMFAGHDTTGALVSWTLFSLGNELDIQKKVHEELDEVLGDLDDQATLKQIPNLKYLDRVIKETLRLYPSTPKISRCLIDDMQIGDYIIPKDVTVEIEIYRLHRDPSVWPDPLRFDPDRFLAENVKSRHPYAYLPFSAGPRNCLGQKYALLEVIVILAQILRKFNVKSVESHSTIKKNNGIILRPLKGMYVHMKKRIVGRHRNTIGSNTDDTR